jgi:hypothetical protein
MAEPTPTQLCQAADDVAANRLAVINDAITEQQELLAALPLNHPARASVYESIARLETRLQVGRLMVWQRQHPRPPRPTPEPWSWAELLGRAVLVVMVPITALVLISWLLMFAGAVLALGGIAAGIWLLLTRPWRKR